MQPGANPDRHIWRCPEGHPGFHTGRGGDSHASNLSITGFYIGAYLSNAGFLMATVGELIGFIATGQVKMRVGKVLPLSHSPEAHRLLEGRKTTGKVVLKPWADA